EVCGVVDAVGPDVEMALGSRIMAVTSFTDGRGGFAESTIVRAVSAFRVPDDMSDVDAAGFRIGFSTAWIGLVRRGRVARRGVAAGAGRRRWVRCDRGATRSRTRRAGHRGGFGCGEGGVLSTH